MVKRRILAGAFGLAALLTPQIAVAEDVTPKNIIVMIADGAGYNMLAATRYWHGRGLAVDGGGWETAALSTYALRRDKDPLGAAQDPDLVYDSAKNWDAAPLAGDSECAEGYPVGWAGYEWNRCTYPDSAGTMSAMMTGIRAYNGALNVDGMAEAVQSVPEAAKAAGMRVGSISSVPFTHATVASGGGAHNEARGNYHEIAAELLRAGTLDILGGGGHPLFGGAGEPQPDPVIDEETGADERFAWLSPEDWAGVRDGSLGWTLVEDRADIQALATMPKDGRILMLPKVARTLQMERPPKMAEPGDPRQQVPGETPMTPGIPTLTEMTAAALTHLEGDAGLFLQVEGGAVDWAMHANFLGRAIEEQTDFDNAVRLVEAWVADPSNGSSWANTLVVVTADHDHMLFGPSADVPFQPVSNRGAGQLPGHIWWSGSHSNQLVPFFVRGAGSARLMAEADEIDRAVVNGQVVGRGKYLTQPEMGQVLLDLVVR
ncbi:MAG: alkaline phosphatase [Pacificimonas sp.]|jgi:alkaline phosphatase|nr:alkaline phosphatase [Pacificimonas sp.]